MFLRTEYTKLWRKNAKLKLGRVRFEMREVRVDSIVISKSFEMVFTEQPTTWAARQSFEASLKGYEWRWDLYNITALILILGLIWFTTAPILWSYLESVFPTFVNTPNSADTEIVHFTLQNLTFSDVHYIRPLVTMVTELITYFSFLS